MEPPWTSDWAWALPLTALTIMIHVSVITGIAAPLLRVKAKIEKTHALGQGSLLLLAIAVFGSVGLALATLNGLDVAIWAFAYLQLGAISSMANAMLFSMNAMTALGSSGLDLRGHWKMMGALEAANGLLLFGISTAFLASIISECWSWLPTVARKS